MQETLIHFAEQHLYLHIVLIIFCTAAILIAMALDLFFGIRKAHERGQPTTSRGLKMTSRKAVKYLVPFLVLSLIDIIGSPLCAAPYFSMGWAAWCVLCEFWSIREKAWEKAEIEKLHDIVQATISEHDLSKMAQKFAAAVFDEAKNRDIVPAEKTPAGENQEPENAKQ